jgi:uncharacterized protein YkwD
LIVAALVLIASFILIVPYIPSIIRDASGILSRLASIGQVSVETGSNVTNHSYSPLIQNGSANITFPSDYSILQAYALKLINDDRANSSVGPVNLSSNQAGQQHADSMLTYGFFSHYDTQGYKPYMRYSLLGGRGADAENVAYIQDPSAHFSTSSVENAIKTLEHAMIYNDSACCNNGHRDNILGTLHNKVSIGIAYDTAHVYFDEEFENDYITLSFFVSSTNQVTMTGVPLQSSVTGKSNSIYIAFDSTPQPQTPAQLNNGPNEYGPGTLIGGVLPPCNSLLNACRQFNGISVNADTWKFSSTQVDVSFSLQEFIRAYGSGVYTVYLITGSDTSSAITSISVFVK